MVELLTIVQAEQAADALIKEAEERRQQARKEALAQREAQLANLEVPDVKQPTLRPANPDVDRLKATAKRNQARAVKVILEAIHAQD